MAIDYEALVESFYRMVLKPGDIAVDVGAHVGRHALPMAECVGSGGKVYCFEPLPQCRDALVSDDRFRRFGNVIVFPYALGDRTAVSEFVVAKDLLGYSGLKERTYDAETRLERIDVEVRRLDDVLAARPGKIAYLKVDAEGGELAIFEGAKSLIKTDRPLVSFEFGMNSAAAYGAQPEAMYQLWTSVGYRVSDILGRDLDAESFSRSAHRQEVWDYLAVPEESYELIIGIYRRSLTLAH